MPSSSFAVIFAQVLNSATAAAATNGADPYQDRPGWFMPAMYVLIMGTIYFAFIRPQSVATKKKEQTIKSAKTGDKIVTSSGIHGVISNVKDATVIVKIADNVKIEVDKTHIEKIVRSDSTSSAPEKPVAAKA